MALALIGFAASAADNSLGKRVAELSDLKIKAALSESAAELDQADPPTQSTQETPLSQQEQSQIQQLSQRLASEIRNDKQWGSVESDLRREVVKEEIRRRTSPEHQVTSTLGDSPAEQAMSAEDNAGDPVDHLADAIAKDISSRARKSPALRDKIKTWYDSHFEAATIDNLHEFFVDQTTDGIFGFVPNPSSAWRRRQQIYSRILLRLRPEN